MYVHTPSDLKQAPPTIFAHAAMWNQPPVDVFSQSAVIVNPEPLTKNTSDTTTGKAVPDPAARKETITRALRRLRAIARKKPIGTVEEFVAARRAAAAKE